MVWPEKGFHLPKPQSITGPTPTSGSDGMANNRFESPSDVAHHLGLSTNPPLQSVNIENGFVSMQNSMPLNQRRNESSWFSRASGSQQRWSIPGNSSPLKSLSSGVESLSDTQDGFPIQFEDFYLISAGVIDSRPSYRNTNQIWPVGYRSVWHDKTTGSLFVFDITDGGDSGPNFKVQRYPCVIQPIPVGSIALSRPKREDGEGKDESTIFGIIDEESLSIQMMLTENSAPSLDDDISSASIGEPECDSRGGDLPSLDSVAQRSGNFTFDILGQRDSIGEFAVEGRSPSSVWEKVSETFLHACFESYNKTGLLQLGCDHCEMYPRELENVDSLSKFTHLAGPISNPRVMRSSDEFHLTCDLVAKWLQLDRFGLDAEFVQEIIEQLPGVSSCSGYTLLTKRKHPSTLQTVGSGFFQAKRKCLGNLEVDSDAYFGILKGARDHSKHSELRGPLPPGKPICSRLPADLISDALQVWEFSCRFGAVLGLQLSSFQELENELINPWLDGLNPRGTSGTEIQDSRDISSGSSRDPSQARASCRSFCICTGIILTNSHGSLLKLLVGELLSKVTVYVDPNFDAGDSKTRRGRKKDAEHGAVLKKKKLEMMPVNELTWPEIARRYILAVLSMEGNLDSAEIASRESGKVFHLLRGDGGILCGTEVAALEADALLLAEATKKIFGALMPRNEIVSTDENETDVAASSQTMDMNNGEVPEWAQVLEPVRKLPTNVGARIRKCVYEALEKNPPEWARKRLEHSISKDVYKGNASGPTKRAVVEVLADVSQEKLQQKPEKKEKVKSVYTVSNLIMKQCRIVLRKAASADEDRVFCNLLSRTLLNPNDIDDDEGILGYPAMVSRPLNFRTIDVRLANGAYGGSHEAFHDDVREVWHNVRIAYSDQLDLIELAESLSQQFEDLYEKEVITFVQKIMGAVSSSESEKERDDALAHVNDSSVPKAPWEDGICRVCGMDKDDDNVLLCDTCDDGYHRYCLNPSLSGVPAGNWYCPSCVAAKSSSSENAASGNQILNQREKRRYQSKHIGDILEGLAQLVDSMELKEYWELTVEQRISLIKFLCCEAMNSPIIRDHIDQCASKCIDLQQKLRSLNSERKILKLKGESLAANMAKARGSAHSGGGGDFPLNGLASVLAAEAQLPGDTNVSPFSGGLAQMEDGPRPMDRDDLDDQSCRYSRSHDSSNSQNSNQTNTSSLHEYNAELGKLQHEISCVQESISNAESELLNVSFRKEFLGRDSYGRLYWVFARHDANPWIVANGTLNPEMEFGLDNLFPKSTSWMYYDTVSEIEELVNWLDDCDMRERELKEAILQWISNKSLNADCKRKDLLKGKTVSCKIPSGQRDADLDFPVSNAVRALEKKFGPGLEIWANHIKSLDRDSEMIYQGRMCRCECLELFWPSRLHCFSCHKTFSTSEEFNQHVEKCRTVARGPGSCQLAAGSPKQKKIAKNRGVRICSGSSNLPPPFVNEKHDTQSSSFNHPPEPDFPFNFEEILSKFKVETSLKEVIKEIGLIGTNGVVPFLPNRTPCLDDPSLTLVRSRDNDISMRGQPSIPESRQQLSETDKGEVSGVERVKSRVLSGRIQLSSIKGRSSLSIASFVRESSLRPKVGRASEVLRFLKINLLDIDAALPEASLRASRSRLDRRCAWRTFVKSANTLYEMVLALIILEDTIRTDYLKNDWWYWSSPSGAANISTLSALAFRIYTLDSAILYEKPSNDDTAGTSVQDGKPDMEVSPSAVPTNDPKSADQPTQSDSGETSRPRTRMSKKRKDSSC